MRVYLRVVASACCWTLFASISVLAAERATTAPRSPKQLVRRALQSELAGEPKHRELLLAEALRNDPRLAEARWQSGFVRWQNKWLTPDEVAQRAASDKTLAAYARRRASLVDTADEHRELARWCHKNKLPDEARVHWAKVLEFGDDAEALRALGLKPLGGQLVTQQQIDEFQRQLAAQKKAYEQWQPRVARWRAAIESGDSADRSDARESIGKISDPAALVALEEELLAGSEGSAGGEMYQLLIDSAARMPQQVATQLLLRHALLADQDEQRQVAAAALKQRPLYAFVPALLAAMPNVEPAQTRLNWYFSGTTLVHEYDVRLPGDVQDRVLSFRDEKQFYSTNGKYGQGFVNSVNRAMVSAQANVERNRHELAMDLDRRHQLQRRIEEVLLATTDLKGVETRELWRQQWDEHTESYRSPPPPRRTSYEFYDRVTYVPSTSCFLAGTPVVTLVGQRPIEEIKPGDRVLAQDVASGELGYKTVQAVTLRPPAPMLRITAGGSTVLATRGHPFWVVGQGWQMAKQLSTAMSLHTLHGAVAIENLEEGPRQPAYNLVVSDWNTYFVGQNRLLVHDNMPLIQAGGGVPGLQVAGP